LFKKENIMKNYLFQSFVLAATFSIGFGACILYYFQSLPEVAAPELVSTPKTVGCQELKTFPGLSKDISEIKRGKSDYFPKNLFGNDMSPKHSQAGWYGNHLKAMNEKSLLNTSDHSAEIYRFLWLRSFDHPIFVRVERRRHHIEIFTKELDGAGGYEPGKSLRTGNYNLTKEEWNKFTTLLESANYWNMPNENEDLGHDGAEWILEGVKENRYHIVDRWSPREGNYREACIYLLKLSGVDVDKLKDDLY
jgi:hypothetical protein